MLTHSPGPASHALPPLPRLPCRMELCLQQNVIANMFACDFRDLSETDVITGNKSDTILKEYQSFTDLKFSKDKLITCIDWHPSIKGACVKVRSASQACSFTFHSVSSIKSGTQYACLHKEESILLDWHPSIKGACTKQVYAQTPNLA